VGLIEGGLDEVLGRLEVRVGSLSKAHHRFRRRIIITSSFLLVESTRTELGFDYRDSA